MNKKTKTTTHWVDEFLLPLNACESAVVKARAYPDPKTAWDAWDNGTEMLWTLEKCGETDVSKLVFCACEIAERVLPLFETQYPNDKRPREAIEAARNYAENPTEENRAAAHAASAAASAADADANAVRAVRAASAAFAAVRAARAASAADATTYAVASAAGVASVAECKVQAEIVRKYFPVAPAKAKGGQDE